MKKKRIKYLGGVIALAAQLFLTSCGAKTNIENIQEETVELEEPTLESIALSGTVESTVKAIGDAVQMASINLDEFSEERASFESLISNYEIIYTDEFKSLDDIYINWNEAANRYEISAESGDDKYEINFTEPDLINFLIHQTSCKKLTISHDKDEQLISSLTACETVSEVIINDCKVTSIEGLSVFENLESLTINNCENVTDLTPIGNLTKLNKIAINGTRIADISPLANLSNLSYINLRFNEITNPEVLENLENITNLDLEFNRIEDIENLRGLIDKGILSEEYAANIIESAKTHRLSFTTENYQEEARVLYISYIDSKQAYFVELRNDNQETLTFALTDDTFDFYNLTRNIPNCTGIKLTNLPEEHFHFSIADAEKYNAMVIDHCDITSLSIVDDFKNLTYLSIDNCPNLFEPFDTILFNIYSHRALKTLIIQGTSINNFDALKNLSALEYLELRNNDIEDFNFLTYMPSLKAVFLSVDNYPVDAKPLETIQANGVYVDITGYYLPPLEEQNSQDETLESSVDEEIEEEKELGLTP